MTEIAKDLCAGTMAGMMCKVVEYPMDTVKVRLQDMHCTYRGTLDCIVRMFREEGPLGFYRGLPAPLYGCMIDTATIFVVYNGLSNTYRNWKGSALNSDLPLAGTAAAGFGAGLAVSVVLTPIELVKCRMQVQDTLPPEKQVYKGVWHCACRTVSQEGVRGLFRGYTSFAAREAPGSALWYAVYEGLRSYLAPHGGSRSDVPLLGTAMAGAAAGFSYWTATFPTDVVKTRIQVDPEYANHTLKQGLKDVYREGGVRSLYKGWGVTVARAMPSHALLFVTYEYCKRYLDTL